MAGDCYAANGRAILLGEAEGQLCHGEVFKRETGRFHGHCWIETQVMALGIFWVRDLSGGRDIALPRTMFYERGRVRRVKRYTPEQIRLEVNKTGRWGPWPDSRRSLAKSRRRRVSTGRREKMGATG